MIETDMIIWIIAISVLLYIIFKFVEGIVGTALIIFTLLFGIYFALKYFLGIDILVHITGTEHDPEIDIIFKKEGDSGDIKEVKPYKPKKQVFNIPENTYSYDDAKAVCSAFGARLANYMEVENAYNNGANWCNYGWSDGQMALFPTQKSVYDKLQNNEGHEHDCGRPGVNGGFMENPDLKFGVNCFGIKPKMTSKDKLWMETQPIVPKTKSEIDAENKINYWKKNLDKLLVSPFNKNNWSRY